ncbi:unnamed protein product [Amoebophrya sp. A25]|nr:unnamed protein product [Amoebophrya sp. A25]|eukprot:GSA25T00019479001.1
MLVLTESSYNIDLKSSEWDMHVLLPRPTLFLSNKIQCTSQLSRMMVEKLIEIEGNINRNRKSNGFTFSTRNDFLRPTKREACNRYLDLPNISKTVVEIITHLTRSHI